MNDKEKTRLASFLTVPLLVFNGLGIFLTLRDAADLGLSRTAWLAVGDAILIAMVVHQEFRIGKLLKVLREKREEQSLPKPQSNPAQLPHPQNTIQVLQSLPLPSQVSSHQSLLPLTSQQTKEVSAGAENEERIFIPHSPLQIAKMIGGGTTLDQQRQSERFVGKWIRTDAIVQDIKRESKFRSITADYEEGYYVFMVLDRDEGRRSLGIHGYFGDPSSVQLDSLTRGDHLSFEGRITSAANDSISLDECSILESKSLVK